MSILAKYLIASETNNFRPPVLSYKAFILYGILMLILRIFLGVFAVQSAAVDSGTIMNLINEERKLRNLTVLITHNSLVEAAQLKSQDMIERDYFAHIDPDGNYVWGKITDAGYGPYKILGENLALDFSTSEGMVKAWLDSPSHRANLLHVDFVNQGLVALYGDYQNTYTNLTTSLFGTLVASTNPPPAPPPPQPVQQTPPPPVPQVQNKQTVPPPPTPPTAEPLPEASGETPSQTPTQTPADGIMKEEDEKISARSNFDPFVITRIISTILGLFLLVVLGIDSVIIHKHELQLQRTHSSYHLSGFVFIVLVSILIWYW